LRGSRCSGWSFFGWNWVGSCGGWFVVFIIGTSVFVVAFASLIFRFAGVIAFCIGADTALFIVGVGFSVVAVFAGFDL
jgi:hypothetical protein